MNNIIVTTQYTINIIVLTQYKITSIVLTQYIILPVNNLVGAITQRMYLEYLLFKIYFKLRKVKVNLRYLTVTIFCCNFNKISNQLKFLCRDLFGEYCEKKVLKNIYK